MYYRWAGASYTSNGRDWLPSADRWLASVYQDVEAVSPTAMYLVGLWATVPSYGEGLAFSSDGGHTFDYRAWDIDTSPRYASFVDEATGFITGGQWPYEETARFGKGTLLMNQHVSLDTRDPGLRAEYEGYRGVIARTTDGGLTYEMLYDDYDRFYFNGIHFLDAQHGWAVAEGDEGAWVLRTTDGGVTWEESHFEPAGSLMQIRMVDDLEGWAVGAVLTTGFKSLFLHTVDGGATWSKVDTTLPYYVMNIDAVDADHIWAVAYGIDRMFSLLRYQP